MTTSRSRAFGRGVRLSRSVDYSRVFEQPLRLNHPAFLLLARPNGLDTARLGLAISKRCAALAVDRHRLKRLFRESFRQARCRLPCCDIIVLGRLGVADLTNGQLNAALTEQWLKLARLCERSSPAASKSIVTP